MNKALSAQQKDFISSNLSRPRASSKKSLYGHIELSFPFRAIFFLENVE